MTTERIVTELHAIKGRLGELIAALGTAGGPVARIGSALFDRTTGILQVDGYDTPLSRAEARILSILVDHAGAIVSREDMCAALWGQATYSRTVDTHVVTIRRRLGSEASRIVTVHGCGYRLETGA